VDCAREASGTDSDPFGPENASVRSPSSSTDASSRKGDQVMSGKSDFAPEEWKTLVESPMAASIAVTLAEPSGLWGLLKESMASGAALLEAKTASDANPLVKAIVEELTTSEGRSAARDSLRADLTGSAPADIKEKAIEALRRAGAILDAKAPQDGAAVKSWLQHIGQRVAEAATEGGFLGFGGVAVSEEEKATLAEVARALNVAS
jgi:hypothetical protein